MASGSFLENRGCSIGIDESQALRKAFTLSNCGDVIFVGLFEPVCHFERCFTLHLTWRMTTSITAIFLTAPSEYRSSGVGAREIF